MEGDPSGTQLSPDHRIEGADQLFHGDGLGNEAERAQAQHLLDDGGILGGRDHDDGEIRVMSAQIGQPLEAVGPGILRSSSSRSTSGCSSSRWLRLSMESASSNLASSMAMCTA